MRAEPGPGQDFEGWMGKGVDVWCLWDVLMDEHGQVTRLKRKPGTEEVVSVICWAPTSGMLRKAIKPEGGEA